VVGVALLATSTGKLASVTFGLPAVFTGVTRHALPFVTRGMRGRPEIFERGRRLGTDLAFVATRRAAFGTTDVSPSLVEFVEKMTADTPVDVIAEFYDTFVDHDKLHALGVLRDVETLVLVGSRDVVTPVDHSRTMAAQLPTAQLVVVEGAGHMVQLERAAMVTLHLRALVRRASRSASKSA
jgi:pimeloyl-ACP methyl ester carboxylesterase